MSYELRQYSFGETIGKGFNLYFNNFISIVLVSLLCQLPMALLLNNISSDISRGTFGASYFYNLGLLMVLNIVVSAFLSAYIILLVSKKFLDINPAGPENRSTSILPYIFPIIGLSLLVGLFTMLGMIALVVPGFLLALGYSISAEVLVIEKRKIRESMKRSRSLTKGKKWYIFLILLVSGIITVCINQAVLALFRAVNVDAQTLVYLNYAISAITAPIISCIIVVVYFNIRIEKEGFNIEHLAQQFTLTEGAGPSVES